MFSQTIDDKKLRTGEENAILTPAAGLTGGLNQNMTQGAFGQQTIGSTMNQGFMSQPMVGSTMVSQMPVQTSYTTTTGMMQEGSHIHEHGDFHQHHHHNQMIEQPVIVQSIETVPVQQHVHVHNAPVHQHQHRHLQNVVNPKDIREADLYQENTELSRVQANTIAGMPLTRNNIPVQDLGTPYGMGVRRPVHEHYTEHARAADQMHAPHTHVLEPVDRMVGRAGDNLGMLNTQPDALIHADPTAGLGGNMMNAGMMNTGMMNTGMTTMTNQQYIQPATTTTYYENKQYMDQPTSYIVQNPEIQSSGLQFAQQHRVPNECSYCRDENDLYSHSEHIERGWFVQQQPTTIIQETISQPVIQQQPGMVSDTKLPFGGTKPGQYMAQEVPVLYGWGAAPSQRIYKSNEVVGVNYSGATVATKPQKLSRAERKLLKRQQKESYKYGGQHKLEQEYQGNINEQTAHTRNKVFQNVHEPIDSTIVENKIH